MPFRADEDAPSQAPRTIGRYAIYGKIAAGGMATVHFGRLIGAVGFTRPVAIKRLHPQFAKDPGFRAAFIEEARMVSRIRHQNVVPTLDVVTAEDELFLVLDYVQGESLGRLVRALKTEGKTPPPAIIASILSGVLHGLHAAHDAGELRLSDPALAGILQPLPSFAIPLPPPQFPPYFPWINQERILNQCVFLSPDPEAQVTYASDT